MLNETIKAKKFTEGWKNKTVENCKFIDCDFHDISIERCRFVFCKFINCDLSMIKLNMSSFSEVVFEGYRLIGINWTQAKWPKIKLDSPISFYQCNISSSSFYELPLAQIVFESCKAHDVDFRYTDLSGANFGSTDLENSLFMHTKLNSADFTDACNYNIDLNQNEIKDAKFSFPEVVSLLNHFDIKINGM